MKKIVAKTPADYAKQYKKMPVDFCLEVINDVPVLDAVYDMKTSTWSTFTRPATFKEKLDAAKTVINYLHATMKSMVIEDKSNLEIVDEEELKKRAKELMDQFKQAPEKEPA